MPCAGRLVGVTAAPVEAPGPHPAGCGDGPAGTALSPPGPPRPPPDLRSWPRSWPGRRTTRPSPPSTTMCSPYANLGRGCGPGPYAGSAGPPIAARIPPGHRGVGEPHREASPPAQRTTRDTPGHRRSRLRWSGATSSVLQPVQDLPVDPSSPVGSLVTALYRVLLSASWPRGVVPSPHPDRRSVSS
jgi:hypothetical protein